ncbi:MAG: glycosyltransferase [Deltaproteobacteria bacterium]|nr:glycosyltransferase [Deltaproteobacteria bacterium]
MEITILTCLALFVLAALVTWHIIFSRAISRPPEPTQRLARYPSISMIRPIRGIDPGQLENLRAALDNGYPGEIETLFVFDEETDEGLPNALAAVREHLESGRPGIAKIVIAGPPPEGRTGKLNAMIVGSRIARGELIAFGDSDTRPDKKVLRRCVEALVNGGPKVGCAFAPVVVVGDMRSAGDVGYAMMLNSLYAPIAAWAARKLNGELPFIMGQIMVFQRKALDAIGGVGCAAGQLVDDMYIGTCLNKAGYANLMINHPLYIVTSDLALSRFFRVYRRWLMFWRNGLPISFTWPAVLQAVRFFTALILLGVAFLQNQFLAGLIALLAFLAFGLSAENLHKRLGAPAIPFRLKWILWAVLLMAPFVLISMIKRDLDWRGRNYELAWTTRLKKG